MVARVAAQDSVERLLRLRASADAEEGSRVAARQDAVTYQGLQ